MPKIQRKTQKIFCSNAENDQLAVFGSMVTGNPVYTNDIETLQSNEAYTQGWEAATEEDKAPFMEEMNGLQYGLSKQIAYMLQEGIPEYDANTTYYIGSIVKALNDGKPILYTSIIDNNIGNPLTDATSWEELKLGGGSGFNLFDTKLSDHILEGEEAQGWALQGTYVYKEPVAGVRDGYSDFYNKVVERYENANKTYHHKHYLSSNVNQVTTGDYTYNSLFNLNGVIKGFNDDDYFSLPQPFNPDTNTWEIQFKVKFDDISVINSIISTSVKFDGALLQITTDGLLQVYLSGNGTSWNVANGITGSNVFEIEKEYWIKGIFDGSQYVFSYSTNGVDFIDDIVIASTTTLYSTATEYCLGFNYDKDFLNGEVDLNESYIIIGGSNWWSGCNYLEFDYSVNDNMQAFYDISEKEKVDELYNITGLAWLYGVDKKNERIFLPRNDWFEQVTSSVASVGKMITAGLPNITGSFGSNLFYPDKVWEGAFYRLKGVSKNWDAAGGTTLHYTGLDASKISSVYGNSDTVQPNAVKKLLYICVGNTTITGAVTEAIDVTTTENDTIPLFTKLIFDIKPNNLSWLKGGEQVTSGGIYTTAYNELVNCLNGVNKYNIKVIEANDKVGGVDYSEYWIVSQDFMSFAPPSKNENAYFKVANAVQNLELLDVGEVLETVNEFNITKANVDLSNCTKPYVVEMSDKSLLPSWYRVWSNGWCEQGGLVAGGSSANDVTLLRNFVDINYSVITTHNYTSSTSNYGSIVNIIDNSSFTIYSNGDGAKKCNKIWQASGYIS